MSEWINVSDDMPKKEEWVLLYLPKYDDLQATGFLADSYEDSNKLSWELYNPDCGHCYTYGTPLKDVTHWMPLPPNPKEQ